MWQTQGMSPDAAARPTSVSIQSLGLIRDVGLLLAAAVKQFEIPPLGGGNSLNYAKVLNL